MYTPQLPQVPCCHSLVASRSSMTVTSHPRGANAFKHIERVAARTSLDVAIDAARVATLRTKGYSVTMGHIPKEITPRNRIIFARAPARDAAMQVGAQCSVWLASDACTYHTRMVLLKRLRQDMAAVWFSCML